MQLMTPHPLPALRFKANIADDKPWARVADDAEAAAVRRVVIDEDVGPVIDTVGAAMVEDAARRAMDRTRLERAAIVLAAERDAGRLGEEG